jgi:hypothetical protein
MERRDRETGRRKRVGERKEKESSRAPQAPDLERAATSDQST